jgi:methionyl-tRNA formyltransferase
MAVSPYEAISTHARIAWMKPRLVFMGSPDFALPSLRALALHYPIAGVVTQPDRPAGRKRLLTPPPVKRLAVELGLPVIQPERLKDPSAMLTLADWQPEIIVVAAYGQILRKVVLDLPKFGCINVHASLLPRWRGAAPIQAAILAGDEQTGVTIMRIDSGVDTGPVLSQSALPIESGDTAGSLSERLAEVGATQLIETLHAYLRGDLQPIPQPDTGITYAPLLKKEDGLLDLTRPALALSRQVRAFNPWPGAFLPWKEQQIKVQRAHSIVSILTPPGTHLIFEGKPAVATAGGVLILDVIQPAGKKVMSGEEFLRGARDWAE